MPRLSPSAFRVLFEDQVAFVWRVLKRHGVPERELDDGCQEVFMIVHRKYAEFEGRSSVRTWIYGIAAHVALAMRRRAHAQREQLRPEVVFQVAEPGQEQALLQGQTRALLEHALRELAPEQREAFVLHEIEGMTVAEIGSATGVPENTALYRLHRARSEVERTLQRLQVVTQARAQNLRSALLEGKS